MKDLPEFPSVEEFPSLEPGLLHFPLRLSAPAPAPTPAEEEEGTLVGEVQEELPSPATLLIQHLASPLHFVNTHFNGHGRPPGGEAAAERPEGGEGAARAARDAQRSLEALSEEIVSTAISTVVQNTLSALLGAAEEPSLAQFLPAEAPPGPLDPAEDEPELEAEPAAGEEPVEGPPPDDTLPGAEEEEEEEDFELLDQSELELLDEGLGLGSEGLGLGSEGLGLGSEGRGLGTEGRGLGSEGLGLGSEGQAVGGAPETPPSSQDQSES